jgi:hypothetical protein
MKRLTALALVPLVGGCVAKPEPQVDIKPAGPDPVALSRAIASAGRQIVPCYRAPRLNRIARQIVTVLHVYYSADGMLAQTPVIAGQSGVTDENRMYAPSMARAAIDAVIRCAPVKLPPELYSNGWDQIDLTFSPRGQA